MKAMARDRRNKLRLLPGLKWRGYLTVLGPADVCEHLPGRGGYAVAFDAVAPGADPNERYVYDRTVLTAEQIKQWTGVDLSKGKKQ